MSVPAEKRDLIVLDGSRGEGGGQILRTAITLSLLTGQPFRMVKIRANRDKPGLRPQHQKAVESAAELANAHVIGNSVGSRELTFTPEDYSPRDLEIDIGTAGSTGLVLQTLHLAIAMRASGPVRLALTGGTFNPKAPTFPFLLTTWCAHLQALGTKLSLAMPAAGFYPRGGGRLEAWIEPGSPQPLNQTSRGPLSAVRGIAGVSNLKPEIAERMRDRAIERLASAGIAAEIKLASWPSRGQGAAIALSAHHDGIAPATFIGLGERGRPAERVADEAIDELLAFESIEQAAFDQYSADQILLPLALASGRSEFTVSEVTEHLRTNAHTIRAFIDREITIQESSDDGSGLVIVH
jgi:RNA 3'-terminal phosphate cyclase (ATP)